jgi:hypothetical protein
MGETRGNPAPSGVYCALATREPANEAIKKHEKRTPSRLVVFLIDISSKSIV